RYKQSYLGLVWAILKPVTLMLVFTLLNSIIGITSGDIPYPLLSYTALIPWIFFQESTSEGVGSIVHNAQLIRKIYFQREIFPLTLVLQILLIDHVARHWSDILYRLYTFNPLSGIIDAFQRTVIYGQAPDWDVMWPGLLLTLLALPLSYVAFKRAEMHFADIV